MSSEEANESRLYDHLGLITNEVFEIKDLIEKIASRQAELKTALEEVDRIRQDLVDRVSKVDTITKEAVEIAVADDQAEQDIKKELEEEKFALELELDEKGTALNEKEATIKELEESLTSKIHELEERIREKSRLLEMRDAVLKDLKSATGALNSLAENLESLEEENLIALEGAAEQGGDNAEAIDQRDKEAEERETQMAEELQRLKGEIREKEILLGAKEMNIEMIKQTMGAKIAELEKATKSDDKKKAKRFVSFLTDVGKKDKN